MRTKILLTAAAALVAGLVSSNAQVYSANVVGYANVPLAAAGGYTLLSNPFDDGNGNQSSNLLSTLPNKSQVITWNGTGYNTAIGKSAGAWGGSVALPPGTGFFVKTPAGTPLTNTFVGSVIVLVGASGTNAVATGYNLVGSEIPYAADATTDTNINLGATLANKSQMIDWNSGAQDFDTAVGKSAGSWGSSFPISVGEGFFVKTPSAANWVETLNP